MDERPENWTMTDVEKLADSGLENTWKWLEGRLQKNRKQLAGTIGVERAASLLLQELWARDMDAPDGELQELAKSRATLRERLDMLPGAIPLQGSEISLTLQAGNNLGLEATLSQPHEVQAVADALRAVGIPVLRGDGQHKSEAPPVQLYSLALVKSETLQSVGGEGAAPHENSVATERKDTEGGRAEFIACSAPEKQIIYYLVSEPDSVDAHGHQISAADIESALHGYMANSREVKLEHKKTVTGRAVVVEGFIAPADLHEFHGAEPPDGPIKKGSSIVGIHYTDGNLWDELRSVDHGISWGGFAQKVDL